MIGRFIVAHGKLSIHNVTYWLDDGLPSLFDCAKLFILILDAPEILSQRNSRPALPGSQPCDGTLTLRSELLRSLL